MKEPERREAGRKRAREILDALLSLDDFSGLLEDYMSTYPHGEPHKASLRYSKNGFEIETLFEKNKQEYELRLTGDVNRHYEVDPRVLLAHADDFLTDYSPTKRRGRILYEYLNFKVPYKSNTVIEMLVEGDLPVYMKEYKSLELFLVAFTFNREVLEQEIKFDYAHKQ